jgi:pimeloyl-ACP methyl ester carboxylesterase
VQGDKDQLFPVQMAADLVASRGTESELVVVPGLKHNQPFHRPESSYWERIAAWLL